MKHMPPITITVATTVTPSAQIFTSAWSAATWCITPPAMLQLARTVSPTRASVAIDRARQATKAAGMMASATREEPTTSIVAERVSTQTSATRPAIAGNNHDCLRRVPTMRHALSARLDPY
jgi:hypothetical protein